MQSILRTLVAILLCNTASATPHAQSTSAAAAKPPHRQVTTACAQCVEEAKQVNQAYDSLNYLWDRKLSLEKSIAITEKAMAERAAEISRMESATPPSGRSLQQQQTIDGLKAINAQQQSGVARQRRDLADIDARIAEQNTRIADFLARLAACEQRCKTPPASPPLTATAGPTPGIKTTAMGLETIVVSCPACQRYAEMILDLQEAQATLLEQMSRLETKAELAAGGLLGFFEGGANTFSQMEDVADDLADIDAELGTVWALLTVCILNCNVVPKPIYTRPYVYGSTIGAVIGGVVATIGGKQPTVRSPVSGPQQPISGPVQEPAPTTPAPERSVGDAAGSQRVTTCVCTNDQAALNAHIQFCQRVVQILVANAIFGTLRIVAADPVLAGEGPFNTSTGEFDFSTTGHVGGVGAVTLRYAGRIDANGNITFTITYTVNGRVTIYRITTVRS